MTDSDVLSKVQKLLRLSTSSNANEAAMAAAKAQELIDKFKLDATMLELDSVAPVDRLDSEPIIDFHKAGAPLDQREHKLDRWHGYLASVVAKANGCRVYLNGSSIGLVGRPSDAETVRYLYSYLDREVERLTTLQGGGMGRTWRNSFRVGVVDTISKKLSEMHSKFEQNARFQAMSAGSTALVRVNTALAKIEARNASVDRWLATNMRLRKGSGSGARQNHGARQQGQQAGQSIVIGGARAGLHSGRSLNS